jgi:hypothetical protein
MAVEYSLEEKRAARERMRKQERSTVVAPGGSGPHPPEMEPRVAKLEADMKDVKTSLKSLELSSARIEAALGSLATKADIAASNGDIKVLASRVEAYDARLKRVEDAINDTVKTAVGKAIGPLQMPTIIVSTVAALGLLVAAYAWLVKQPWFPH